MSAAPARRFQARDDLVELEGYHSPQVDVAVRLNTNESPESPPAAFRAQLAAEMADLDWNRYPDRGALELRAAIAAHHGVRPEQVLAANGSNEILQLVCLGFGGSGRSAALFHPTYLMHAQIAALTGTRVVTGNRAPDFSLDLGEVQRVMDESHPAITFLCSPNNPTGTVCSPEEVAQVASLAPGVVVVDEAYGQFARWSALELVNEDSSVVVTRTFSKTWSMAAARLGYLIGPAWLVAELDKVVLPYHLDAVKQLAGRVALRFEAEMIERVRALVSERERLATAMGRLAIEQWPSGANFILFRPLLPAARADGATARRAHGHAVWQGLVDRSVLVRDCGSWPGLEGCLRVTVGTPHEGDAFLSALTSTLTEVLA
ncbi:MAG: histidinol-phosphate transaminase [Actinobacteria bacterium]|nr:histidinol-phosphate transaminase [Actinomycetota bacterium]MBI3257339.1 histidinol-phosphate transaminase [Actinomycetota bacterium]